MFDNAPPADFTWEEKELTPQRQRASIEQIAQDPYAVVDHLPFHHCFGTEGASFRESEFVPGHSRALWAEAFGSVCNDCAIATEVDLNEFGMAVDHEWHLERRLKMFFLLPTLIFRKEVDGSSTVSLAKLIRRRLLKFKYLDEWKDLIAEFESDLVHLQSHMDEPPATDGNLRDANFKRTIALVGTGQMRRARTAILSKGCSDPNDPPITAQMAAKFPCRKAPILPPTDEQCAFERACLPWDAFREVIVKLKPLTAPGLGCLRNEHLTALLFTSRSNVSPRAHDAFNRLHRFCDIITQGRLPWYFFAAWTATSLCALNKCEVEDLAAGATMDCRPVAKGNSLRKAVSRAVLGEFSKQIISNTAPTQFGCGAKAGGTQMIMASQLHLEAHPDHVVVSLDMENAYNEIIRARILQALWDKPDLRPLFMFFYKEMAPESYVGLGGGTQMRTAPFRSAEGEQQGAHKSAPSFCIGVHSANMVTNTELRASLGFLIAGIDDTNLYGPPAEVFASIPRHQERLRHLGLQLNLSKSKCYIHPDHRPPDFDTLRGTIPEGCITNENGTIVHGLKFYGAPIGEPGFVSASLTKAAAKIGNDLSAIEERMDPTHLLCPEVPARQCLWQLILRCLQFKGNYIARHLPPRFTGDFCRTIDSKLDSLIETAIGVNLATLPPFAKERCRLPIRLKGLGVRDLERR